MNTYIRFILELIVVVLVSAATSYGVSLSVNNSNVQNFPLQKLNDSVGFSELTTEERDAVENQLAKLQAEFQRLLDEAAAYNGTGGDYTITDKVPEELARKIVETEIQINDLLQIIE